MSGEVSYRSKQKVVRAVKVSVDGQTKAADKLSQLIASQSMPAESKPGLQRAYEAVTAEHESISDILSRFSDRACRRGPLFRRAGRQSGA